MIVYEEQTTKEVLTEREYLLFCKKHPKNPYIFKQYTFMLLKNFGLYDVFTEPNSKFVFILYHHVGIRSIILTLDTSDMHDLVLLANEFDTANDKKKISQKVERLINKSQNYNPKSTKIKFEKIRNQSRPSRREIWSGIIMLLGFICSVLIFRYSNNGRFVFHVISLITTIVLGLMYWLHKR